MKKSFTLIEVLLVATILSVLILLLLPSLKNSQYRARDARRKADLKQFQMALELYKQCQNPPSYPTGGGGVIPAPDQPWAATGSSGCPTSTTFIRSVPGDPNPNITNHQDYYYARDPASLDKYTLCTCLENQQDTDRLTGQTNCDVSYLCPTNTVYVLHEP